MEIKSTIESKNKIHVPPIQKGKLNIYTPEQIMSFGNVHNFLDHVALKESIEIPDFGFTEQEWDEMGKFL